MAIHYFTEEIEFDTKSIDSKTDWLSELANENNSSIEELNYIFCSDEYLLKINQEYLDHDTYTDIITFDHREDENEAIQSDIFISIDRVKENAQINGVSFDNELSRVMAHGLLHLLGYGDKTEEEIKEMRNAENEALAKL